MNLSTLNNFRHEMYGCFGNGKDALFNLVDALASEAGARSFPELSLWPFFERSWASLYEALEDGQIDAEHLRQVFVDFALLPQSGEFVFVGIDTSNLSRPEAETASDPTLVPIANLPKNAHAASPGWVMSHVVLLPTQAGQGTYVLDTARVRWLELATQVAARQVHAVGALLVARGLHPIIVGDRWYACAPFLGRMVGVQATSLLRVKSNRVFYRPAPARVPSQIGASRKDGERFQCKDESSHGKPDDTWEGTDAKGAEIEVRCWNHLHLQTARSVEVSLIQIIGHGASGKARDPKISWFVCKGDQPVPLAEVSPTYRLRYSHEHGYRFDKQELLWDIPPLSTPERTVRWTWVVACAHNLLDDASRHHFVGDFAPCPLTDRPTGFLGILTGQCRHLATLFHRDLGLLPRSRGILQALADAQRLQIDPLSSDPAITLHATNLWDFAAPKRLPLLVCLISQAQVSTRDEILQMFTKRMSKLTTRAKEELERLREAERTTSEHLIEVLADVLQVTTETQDPASSDQQIREVLPEREVQCIS